jgi:hypothetical protein
VKSVFCERNPYAVAETAMPIAFSIRCLETPDRFQEPEPPMYRLFLLALPLLAVACRGPGIPEELPVTPLAHGQHSDQVEQRFEWITGSRDFSRLWETLHAGDPPVVNFEHDGVIAVFMGERATGGHAIRVERVARSADELLVEVVLQMPGPECVTTQAFTQPYQIVLVPQTAPRATFTTRTVLIPCR